MGSQVRHDLEMSVELVDNCLRSCLGPPQKGQELQGQGLVAVLYARSIVKIIDACGDDGMLCTVAASGPPREHTQRLLAALHDA